MKKILFSIAMVLCLTINQLQTHDTRDALGRTELMNFIIRAEREIKSITADIDQLWHVCFERKRYSDGVDVKVNTNTTQGTSSTTVTPTYRYETVRRASCTEADVYAYKARCQDLENIIPYTIHTMQAMARSQDLYINAIDTKGYTAQNYCYTYEIYQELRRQGATFQYIPYMYFNPGITTAAVIGTYFTIGGIAVGIKYGIVDRYSSHYY